MAFAGTSFLQQELTSVKQINQRLQESNRRTQEKGIKGMKWGQHLQKLAQRANALHKKFPGQGFDKTAKALSELTSAKSDSAINKPLDNLVNRHFNKANSHAYNSQYGKSSDSRHAAAKLATAHAGIGRDMEGVRLMSQGARIRYPRIRYPRQARW